MAHAGPIVVNRAAAVTDNPAIAIKKAVAIIATILAPDELQGRHSATMETANPTDQTATPAGVPGVQAIGIEPHCNCVY